MRMFGCRLLNCAESMRTMSTETAAARRGNRNLKSTKHFCPVPMPGAPNGGYCDMKGGIGRPGMERSQTRWLHGGREAAGLAGADSWEY